jgi:2-polyprenyl-6-methoxyphenol hydroxylase-like FAD-dependent oxidoreductase
MRSRQVDSRGTTDQTIAEGKNQFSKNAMKTFAIVGGGIGGLTLAIALHRKGFAVTVYEGAPKLKSLGAGLVLAGNAMKAFTEIGIGDSICSAGSQIKLLRIKDSHGNILSEMDAEKMTSSYGINNFTIHRADLQQTLLNHLPDNIIQTGKFCVDLLQNNRNVTLHFSDNTTAVVDYVIACDGIHSPIRKKLMPGSEPRYAGYTCWRAVIDDQPDNYNQIENTETWGTQGRFGVVPLTKNRIYWFACVNAKANDPLMRSCASADLLKYFKNFHDPIPSIIRSTRDDQIIWNDIIDLKPMKQFVFNRVVLLGDAAHATTPNMGQGACMAIEDAVVLANCIERHKHIEEAFSAYQIKRIGRTTRIVNTSRTLGRIAQLQHPLLISLRNTMLRMTPPAITQRQMNFIYDISFS